MKTLITALILTSLPTVALASSTTTTYSSGILVLAFLALCGLIVVAQLIPAIMLIAGTLKALLGSKKETVSVIENV